MSVNLKIEDFDAYVGRAGKGWGGYFGNPRRPRPGDRPGEAVQAFRLYFIDRITKDEEYRRRVDGLRGKRLGCFCAPAPCHADVYVQYLEEGLEAVIASANAWAAQHGVARP